MGEYICGIGGANVDFHAQSFAPVVLRDSNPGESRITAGGVTRNVMENLARLGEKCELVTALGDDLFGQFLRQECERTGIGLSGALLCPGKPTTCYVAMNDEKGDMFVGMSDMRLLTELTPERLREQLDLIRGAKAVVLDPNLPEDTFDYLCSGVLDGIRVYVDPVSTTYAKKLRGRGSVFHCMKPNRIELAAITEMETESEMGLERAADVLLEQGCEEVVVSLGEKGCYWAERSGKRFFRGQRPIEIMANATGAGDSFLAGLIHGEMLGYNSEKVADMALSAGRLACSDEDTVSTKMSHQMLLSIMEEFA